MHNHTLNKALIFFFVHEWIFSKERHSVGKHVRYVLAIVYRVEVITLYQPVRHPRSVRHSTWSSIVAAAQISGQHHDRSIFGHLEHWDPPVIIKLL